MKINRKSYRLLQVLTDKAERGARVYRVYVKRNRAKLRALQMSIHAEIQGKLEASRLLDSVGEEQVETVESVPSVRQGWTWGKVQTVTGKGNAVTPYRMGSNDADSDLTLANEPFAQAFNAGLEQAANTGLHA